MLLGLGILLFVLPHFYSSLLPASRDSMRARLGEGAWKGLYSLVTLAGLVLVVIAYRQDTAQMMHVPNPALRHVTLLLAPLGLILISAAHGKSHIKLWVQNPMSWGVILWAVGHLLSVGKSTIDWLLIAVLAIAILDIVSSTLRGKKPNYEPRWRSDIIAVVVGLVLTAIFVLWFHPYVLGVKVAG